MAAYRTAWSGPVRRSLEAAETRHPTRLLSLVLVTWACCVLLASSSGDELRGSVAYPMVPQRGTFGLVSRPALWQLPEGPVRNVLVIFCPRNGVPGDFWDNSPGCPTCQGIPERRNIVADALARNYAVFVPAQLGDEWLSWPEDNPDVLLSREMIFQWKCLLGLQGLPTMGLGVSSGGYILSTLSLWPGVFDAICLMISHGVTDAMKATTQQYPPTVFAYMPRDPTISREITITRGILEDRQVPTAEVTWYPQPLTPDFFSKNIHGVSLELSAAIVDCIAVEGWLDENNFINSDNYQHNWPSRAEQWNITAPEGFPRDVLLTAILFEMKLAYAYHTAFSGKDNEIFTFLEGGYKSQVHDTGVSLLDVEADGNVGLQHEGRNSRLTIGQLTVAA